MMYTNLTGRKEITEYAGRSWAIVKRWIDEEGFPAKKLDGVWESDKDLITEWKREMITGKKQGAHEK